MLAYYGTQLSPHMDRTPEGYLICRDVPIARTGPQTYLARELRLDGDPERAVTVNRHPEDVFDPAVLASFEGKDVTSPHPPENVGPENFSAYSKGHVQNVRHSGDHIVADLIIKDAALVNDVWNGTLREVSCGYMCEYVPDGENYKQQHIRGNHVAVVPRGRAGHEVAIKDSAELAGKGTRTMSKFAEGFLRLLGIAAKDASPEELEKMVTATASVLDAAPKAAEPEQKPTGDACAEDVQVERAPKGDDIGSKLDKVIEMLGSLQHKNDREEKKLHDEKSLDEAIEKLGGGKDDEGKAATIPADAASDMDPAAKDAAVTILRTMRPIVAGIKDEGERSRVVDALLESIKGPDAAAQMMAATRANAQRANDAAQAGTFEARCRESEAAYAARNPHKKKED